MPRENLTLAAGLRLYTVIDRFVTHGQVQPSRTVATVAACRRVRVNTRLRVRRSVPRESLACEDRLVLVAF